MIWEFKQKLYCSEKKVPLSFVTDLSVRWESSG
jgi:hypothetical protein